MVLAALGLVTTQALAERQASSLGQHGITWTFDKEYQVGRFITGDYWIVGPVTITEIDPPLKESDFGDRNGTMINAANGKQGLDGYRTPRYGQIQYDESLNIEARDGLPVTVDPGNSVISAIGRNLDADGENINPMLQSVGILTVVSEPPPADAFRPSYVGADKVIYRWSDVEANLSRLPNRTPVAGIPSSYEYIEKLRGPWALLSVPGWQGRYMHAGENMPNYHREVGRFLGRSAVLVTMRTHNRMEVLKHLLQVGIDYYAVGQTMQGTAAQWQWPVIFAGIMLGDEKMRDVYLTGNRHPDNGTRGQRHLYRLPEENRSAVDSAIVPGGKGMTTWTGHTAAWRQSTKSVNCYHQEHLHPSEWSSVTAQESCPQSLHTRETYRRINSPAYALMALAASSMGERDRFYRSDLYFDYAERWMDEDLSSPEHDVYGKAPRYTIDSREYGSTTSGFADRYYQHYGWAVAEGVSID
ncbi:hypothetical protein EV698_0615 [Spiribacter vilamensis]|uniref:Uncharacterized protein n=2 Tax=Spiribacter vilamensis TaxID=531306 RepID=A0A4Q8CZL9_9GAMM|nr:hypothetical protein EV698_0615 [Spiribacter vilamensis]